jgi:hypothetical protein
MNLRDARTRTIKPITTLLYAAALTAPLLAVGVLTQPASAAANPVVEFQRSGTQLCIRSPGLNNSQLSDRVCNRSLKDQRWTVINDVSGLGLKFVNQALGLSCMNVQNFSTAIHAPIVVSDCSEDPTLIWDLVNTTVPGNGTFVIKNVGSHLCLNVVVGGLIEQDPCDLTSTNQVFTAVTVG